MKKTGEEPWSVPATAIEGDASCAFPMFYNEVATTEVEGVGKIAVGMAINGMAMYVMIRAPKGVAHDQSPPTLYTVPLQPLMQTAIGAAIERFKTGEPAVWIETDAAGDPVAKA